MSIYQKTYLYYEYRIKFDMFILVLKLSSRLDEGYEIH